MRTLPALAVLAVGLTLALALSGGSSAKGPVPCKPVVSNGVLPDWARGGFSEKQPRIAHEVGRMGWIAAILFAQPLLSPAGRTVNNKILWVARNPQATPSDLRISAQRMLGARPVGAPVARRVQGGPGPSIINLPRAGCWRFTLRWSHNVDELDLAYVPRGSR
jgi:hypothetical protein